MNNTPLLLITSIIFFVSCSQKEKKVSEEEKYEYVIKPSEIFDNKNLPSLIQKLEKTELTTKNDKAKIPEIILNFLNSLSNDFSIANPNEKWNATDVIIDKDLPRRKLIYFGEGKNIALMSYYSGGIGKSTKILIFEFDNEKIIDFWSGNVLVDFDNKNEILEFLKNNTNKRWALNSNILSY